MDVAISPDSCRFPEINSRRYPNTLYEFRITSGHPCSPTTWMSPSQGVRSPRHKFLLCHPRRRLES